MKKSYAILTAVFGAVLCLSGIITLIIIGQTSSFNILCQKAVQSLIAISLGGLIALVGLSQGLEAANR